MKKSEKESSRKLPEWEKPKLTEYSTESLDKIFAFPICSLGDSEGDLP